MCFPALAAIPAALGLGTSAAAAAAAGGAAVTAPVAATAGTAAAGTASAAGAYQAIGTGLSALGSALSAYQGVQADQARQAVARRQAELERRRGDFEVRRLRERGERLLGARRAGLLASGIALEGSAADTLADAATELSLDEQAARFGAQLGADNALYDARLAGAGARSAAIGGALDTLAPVIETFASRRGARPAVSGRSR
jgi:hypothetical protein